jgi:cobalt/nickel transport system permease protein
MVSVHVLIGIGEAVISCMVVTAVLASRPDLVTGASDLSWEQLADRPRVAVRTFVFGGVLTAVFFAVVVSQFAASDPDGLERVAEDEGFLESGRAHAFADSLFADYATAGIDNQTLSLGIAGLAGVTLTLLVGYGIVAASRRTRSLLAQ